MYLVFKSTNAAVTGAPVYGVEFCNGAPSFVTKESDMIYVDIGDGLADATRDKVNQILANIDTVSISVKVSDYESCTLDKIAVSTDNPDRSIDPEDWDSTVLPSWYRAANYTDHAVI